MSSGAIANLRGTTLNGDALKVALVNSANAQIDTFGGSGGTASNFGSPFPAAGTAAGASDGANMVPLLTDGSGFLKVNVAAGGTSGQQYADGAARGTATGTLAMGDDGTNIQSLKVDSSGVLAIQDNGGTITVDGTVTANLAAGTQNIGDVDVLTVPADPFGVNADAASATGSISAKLKFIASTGIPITGTVTTQAAVAGDVAHDGVDSGNPVKLGLKALAHGTNPTAVAAADRTNWFANRAGIPWVIGGHPNVVSVEAAFTAAQTDTALITVSAGTIIVVTAIEAIVDARTTVAVDFRIGFGTVNTPTTTGVILSHPGVLALSGGGIGKGNGAGIIGIGADGADLRITSSVPTTGSLRVVVTFYTIES